MRISDWSSYVCSSDLPRCHGTVGAVGDVLDDDGVFASAAKVARIAGELVVGYLGVQIAEAQVDDPVGIGTHHAFDLDAIDIGADIDVDRSEEHTSELQSLMRNSYAVFCLKKTTKKKKLQYIEKTTKKQRVRIQQR